MIANTGQRPTEGGLSMRAWKAIWLERVQPPPNNYPTRLLSAVEVRDRFKSDFRFSTLDQIAIQLNIVIRRNWHRTFAPARRLLPSSGYPIGAPPTRVQKLNAALCDAMYSLLLYGYDQVSGLKVSRATSSFLCLLHDLISQVNEVCLAHSRVGGSFELGDLFQHPLVVLEEDRMTKFLLANNRAFKVRRFLYELLQCYFCTYTSHAAIDAEGLSWEECLKLEKMSSSIQLSTLMEAIRLFNCHPESENLRAEFYALGIIRRIADDLLDLKHDIAGKCPNLVYAASRDFPVERARILTALSIHEDTARSWWMKYAPNTFGRCSQALYEHYTCIHSPALQLAFRLMWLPTVQPMKYNKYRICI